MWNSSNADFMNTSNTQNVNSPSKKGGARRLQNVVPVVVRQIRDCPDEEFTLFGMSTQIICIVGILKECNMQSTKATYRIEDHTGVIEAIYWLENDSDTTPNLPSVKENTYVQVFGTLRTQNGEKMMMVLRMIQVDNVDICTSHLLQVINTRLQAESLNKTVATSSRMEVDNPGANLPNSMSFMDENMTSNTNGHMGLNPLQTKVFNILLTGNHLPQGMPRDTILNKFPENQHRDVNNTLEFLMNEGHAYSTIDNDHFKATD